MHQLAEWNVGPSGPERPPTGVVRAAKAAFARRAPASEVAPLLWDSDAATTAAPPDGDRSPASRRLLFATDDLGVELSIGPSTGDGGPGGATRSLQGRLLPPVPAALWLVRDTGAPVPVVVDAAGRFTAEGVAPGLLRLRAARPGRRCLHTAWILVD